MQLSMAQTILWVPSVLKNCLLDSELVTFPKDMGPGLFLGIALIEKYHSIYLKGEWVHTKDLILNKKEIWEQVSSHI